MAHELPPATKLAAAIALLTRPGGAAPYFRTMLSLTVARVESRQIRTLAVSADWILAWNPDYVARTPLPILAWGLYHECWHLRSRHHERARALGLVPTGTPTAQQIRNWKLANRAQDASINEQLRAAHGKGLPAEWIYPETLKQGPNLTWEQRYALLLTERQKSEQQKSEQQKSGQGQGEQSQGEGEGEGEGEGAGSGGDASPGEGDDSSGVGCGGCGSCSAGGPPVDSNGTGRSEAEINRALQETARAVIEHVNKKAGPVPGELVRWAQDTLKPAKIDWRDQLAATVKHAIHSRPGAVDYSFRRMSRRQAGLGYGVGAPIVPGLYQPIPRVAVVVDTSGSMSAADLLAALSEIDGLLQALQATVEFIAIDATVRVVEKIKDAREAAAKLVGGGGTDMGPAFRYLGERSTSRPEVVIVLTDGHFYTHVAEPDWAPRTVWVLIGEGHGEAEPWGEQIVLSEMAAA